MWRHLAGFVEDHEEDEDEQAHYGVTNNGHDSPKRQTHTQLMLHAQSGQRSHQASGPSEVSNHYVVTLIFLGSNV